jgi:hypothetical protein
MLHDRLTITGPAPLLDELHMEYDPSDKEIVYTLNGATIDRDEATLFLMEMYS